MPTYYMEGASNKFAERFYDSLSAKSINQYIGTSAKAGILNTNDISDGYHTFGELYEHRAALYILIASRVSYKDTPADVNRSVWRSKMHSDGSSYPGWFLLGITLADGKQITYHLPESKWDECSFAETLYKAPEFDGHTSADVLERLKVL